jgi:predicted Zn-dependent protease
MKNFVKILFVIICISFSISSIKAEENFTIIRDAEIEETLTGIVQKIFDVAGLRKKSAKVYVVHSDSINAFTIGNGYVFVTSGLLLKFKNPLNLIAVLSHETGHLAAGHIDSMISRLQNSSSNFLMAMLAGMLGGLVTGSEEALAVLLGYAMTDERLFLRFSREQELAADALGASYLEKMGYDTEAMIEVFEVFERMEIIGGAVSLPTYVRTHPKSIDRISALRKRKKIQKKSQKCDKKLFERYKRITEKLKSYLGNNGLFEQIPQEDYPKAIYLHRRGKSKEAIEILKKIVEKVPKDVYYKETLAQILNESGNPSEAIKYYKQIYNSKSHVLIKVDYAKALVQEKQADFAIKILEAAKYEDQFNPEIFRLLANAYGQKGRQGLSFFMLAQEQMLLQNYRMAYELLKSSLQLMDKKTESSYIKKAQYFKQLLEREKVKI